MLDRRGPAIGVCWSCERGFGRDARRESGDFEMSFKYFGAAVAVACLLTGFPLELAHGVYGLKEISDNGGSDPFGTVSPVLAPDPNEVAKVDGPDAPNTRSSPPAIVPVSGNYANILPVATSNNFSIPPVIDPLLLQTTFDKGNSNNLRPLANASARQPYPTPTRSSRARTLRLHATLAPAGCARCVREAARASGSRANLFSALLSKNFFRKSPSVLPRHPVATVGRQRGASLLTASTVMDSIQAARAE